MLFLTCEQMEEAEVIQGYFVVNRTMLEMQEKAKGKEKQVSELLNHWFIN